MANEFDTVVVEIRGMERLEAAIEKFVQALNGFGRMAEKAAPEINAVIQAMDGIGLEELNDPAGAKQCWPDAAARAAALFPGVPLVVDPTMTEADGVRLVQAAPDGSTVHLPARPSRLLSDDEPLTPNPLDRYTNR